MNVERFLAMKHSFAYITVVTRSRIFCSSVITWLATLLLTVPLAIIDNNIYLTVGNITISFSIAITPFCQVVLYCETRRHEKEIAAQQVSVEARRKFLREKKALTLTTTVHYFGVKLFTTDGCSGIDYGICNQHSKCIIHCLLCSILCAISQFA